MNVLTAGNAPSRTQLNTANLGALAWSERWVGLLLAGLIVGYISMSRSFAHLGVHPLFIGEVAFGLLLLAPKQRLLGCWLQSLLRPGPFGVVAWLLTISLAFGALQAMRGIAQQHDTVVALQNFTFHVYPLFFFAAVGWGCRQPGLLPKTCNFLAWFHGFYGVLYVVLLFRWGIEHNPHEATGVGLFGQPAGSAISLLWLLTTQRPTRWQWVPLILNALSLLGIMARAEWLGFALAVSVGAALTGRLRLLLQTGALFAIVLALAVIIDIKVPTTNPERGEISARTVVAKVVSVVSIELSSQLEPQAQQYYGSTVEWREQWWRELWQMVHSSGQTALFGRGYGYPIWELHPEEINAGRPLRTPHSTFMFALAYTGWSGVAIFLALQLALLTVLWRTYRQTGLAFGVCYWVQVMTDAMFSGAFETPFGEIPFYLVAGLCVAPLVTAPAASAQTLPDPPSFPLVAPVRRLLPR